jgi:MFS family permease
VPRDEIQSAVSLNAISMNFARAAGPAIGGLIAAAAGVGATFALNAASFLAVWAVLYRWRLPPRERKLPPEELFGAMRAGIRYVRHSPALRTVLVRTGTFVLPASAVWALLPLYARGELGLGAAGYGVLLGFFGAGAVACGLYLRACATGSASSGSRRRPRSDSRAASSRWAPARSRVAAAATRCSSRRDLAARCSRR